jgi:antitoxin (DNA-binding transcriptional repressor) of toxin-antitoxin stability system
MGHVITVGQLRQNPTAMIQDVKDGETYTLTDRGRPVADITPHRRTAWRSAADVEAMLRRLGPDPAFAAELGRLREESELLDPWADRR